MRYNAGKILSTPIIAFALLISTPCLAQDESEKENHNSKEILDLKQRLADLEEQLGSNSPTEGSAPRGERTHGSPLPTKGVGRLTPKEAGQTGVGGYGELHYNSPNGAPDTLDFHRFILHVNHRFDRRLSFVSELEVEHAFVQDGQGELELEQAYISYNVFENFRLNVGVLLIPLGYINRFHEPSTFYSVERPEFEKTIIPSTWFESGANVVWAPTVDFRVEAGLFGGLDGSKFRAKDGIRAGRQKAFKTKVEGLAFAGRINYFGIENLEVGVGFYNGNSNQTNAGFGSARVTGGSFELVSQGAAYGLSQNEFRAEAAFFNIEGAEKISAANGESVPGLIWGFYVEDAYDVFAHVDGTDGMNLFAFARFEYLRGQQDMPAGIAPVQTANKEKLVFGFSFRPHPKIAFKIDYEMNDDRSGITPSNQWNFGLGYMF